MDNAPVQQAAPTLPPAGWYPEQAGALRWWDGQQWGPYAPAQQAGAPPVVQVQHERYANRMPVTYQRQQQGHSLTKWLVASLFVVGIPWLLYYSFSPNHYWHT